MIDSTLAGMIDHTLLKPNATAEQIRQLCREAKEYAFASVCINPSRVKLAATELSGTSVNICTVIGFPLGATSTAAKVAEARTALADGATELDMVINIGSLKDGCWETVRDDIAAVVQTAPQKIIKVIIETCLLTDEEKRLACQAAVEAGASFVKTSTGFSDSGATVDDICLMRRAVGQTFGVKASGGIKNRQTALAMIQAGANRIGTSSGIAIVTE